MPESKNYTPILAYEDVTIASGQTTSGEFDLHGGTLVGLSVPSTFDGTTLTLTAATTPGGTHLTVQNGRSDSSAYTITTTAGRNVPLDNLAISAGLRYIKLVAGTSQSTSDTVLTLAIRPV